MSLQRGRCSGEEEGARATLEIVGRAREEGLGDTFELPANSTGPFNAPNLIGLFQRWVMLRGSKRDLVEKLWITELRDELKESVRGGILYHNGTHTGATSGKVLRRK
jgi:hypothetical protein